VGSLAFTDARVEVNSVDLSEWVTAVELPIEFEELEDTAMGDVGKSRIAGLQDSNVKISWNQDFAASAVDATLWAARGTVIAVKVRPTSSSVGTTNPEYVGSYLVSKYSPFGNKVGELATVETEWPLSDPDGIARNTS
jgi:hypothetical protein